MNSTALPRYNLRVGYEGRYSVQIKEEGCCPGESPSNQQVLYTFNS